MSSTSNFRQRSNNNYQDRRRPPPYNPYSNNGSREKTFYQLKTQILPLVLILSLLLIWFLTPLADVITTIILFTVPVSTDVQLGLESWHSMIQNNPQKYQIIQDQWGVESIGFDLVDSVIGNKYNMDQFCDSIAKTLLSSNHHHKKNDDDNNNPSSLINSALDVLLDTKQHCKEQASKYNWSFQVIQSSDINAFALPGGLIRVTDSLLQTLNLSRGEIAALLGHEMAHVLYRHGQSQMLKRNLLKTVIKALFYDDEDEDDESFGEAIHELMIKSASFLGELKFSRMNEYQADHGAWEILSKSQKYNPRNVQYLLERLYSLENNHNHQAGRRTKVSQSYLSTWDKTHPGTDDRIKELEGKWNQLSWDDQRKFQMRRL